MLRASLCRRPSPTVCRPISRSLWAPSQLQNGPPDDAAAHERRQRSQLSHMPRCHVTQQSCAQCAWLTTNPSARTLVPAHGMVTSPTTSRRPHDSETRAVVQHGVPMSATHVSGHVAVHAVAQAGNACAWPVSRRYLSSPSNTFPSPRLPATTSRATLPTARPRGWCARHTLTTPSSRWFMGQGGGGAGNDGKNTDFGDDGGAAELQQFRVHGDMLLQTAQVALDTKDAEKIRGAKEVCSNYVEAYVGVCRAASPGPARDVAEAQLKQLRTALRNLVEAERGRFEIGVLGQGQTALDTVLPEYRKMAQDALNAKQKDGDSGDK
eukprot:m.62680 g.62680  ORF g.62680 m.62680 type:complete len:323 (-) comp8107_c0_seq1:1723-2691(-)